MDRVNRNDALMLDAGLDDATLLRVLRKACRERAGEVLLLGGAMEAAVDSPGHAAAWVGQLANADTLPVVVAEGPLGPRGLALVLLADLAVLGPRVVFEGSLFTVPNLPELAASRLGALAARRLAFAAAPLDCLVSSGHCRRSQDPWAEVETQLRGLPVGGAARLRKGWRAARDLALDEAMEFGRWLDHPRTDRKETA